MQVSLDKEIDRYSIHAYDETGITLILPPELAPEPNSRKLRVEHSLLLTSRKHAQWAPQNFEGIGAQHIELGLEYRPEVILLGCGSTMRFPGPEILAPAHRLGVGVELMNTAASCRTFNILASEGREVVALMLLPGS